METFNDYLKEAMRLRALWSDTATDFFAFLMTWEADEKTWKQGSGLTTFAEVLNASNVCKPHRFAKFKEAVERAGSVDEVRKLGPDGWEELLKIPADAKSRQDGSVSAVHAVLKEAGEFRERNGCPPSRQTVESWERKHYDPPAAESAPAIPHADRVKQLEHENAELRKTVASQKREIVRLTKQLERTQSALDKATGKKSAA